MDYARSYREELKDSEEQYTARGTLGTVQAPSTCTKMFLSSELQCIKNEGRSRYSCT